MQESLVDANISKKFFKNVVTGLMVLILNVAVGILLTPYLIKHLGVEGYGMVAFALQIAGVMLTINASMVTVLGRFLTIDYENKNYDKALLTFNSILWTVILILTILSIATPAISYTVAEYLDLGPLSSTDVFWLLTYSFIGYQCYVLRSIFLVSCFVRNRLYVQNMVESSAIIIRVVFIILIFSLFQANIWHAGFGIFLGGLCSAIFAIRIWKRLTPQLTISTKYFDYPRLREIFGMITWVLINDIGIIILRSIDLIIINVYIGSTAQGHYATLLQLAILLRFFSTAVTSALAPVITKDFARSNLKKIQDDSALAVKMFGIITTFPAVCIIIFAEQILYIWLGEGYTDLALLLQILILPSVLGGATTPLFFVHTALRRVKIPAFSTLILGIVYIILAVWMVELDNKGTGVAIAIFITLTLKSIIFIPLYTAHIQHMNYSLYFRKILSVLMASLFTLILGNILLNLHDFNSLISLLTGIFIMGVIYLAFTYAAILNKKERKFVQDAINGITKKI